MSDIPLKIRADVRDQWLSPQSELQESISTLTKTLGHKIEPQVQWPLLYNAVKDAYVEKGTFVPLICRVTASFYDRLLSRLENEAHTEWTEQLLNELAKRQGSWQLHIEAASVPIRRPRITWKGAVGAFSLEIPTKPLPIQAEIDAGFDQDLDSLFSPLSTLASVVANEDEWAEVTEIETRIPQKQYSISSSTPQGLPAAVQPTPTKLPLLDALTRPADLLRTTVPYILIVDAATCPLTVQGSHQQSLELLANYLKKWAKVNASDSQKRPVLKVDLVESSFCFGVVDSISIEPSVSYRDKPPINPAIILAFIEGVMGYKEVHTTGVRWVFKSDTIFK